MHEDILIPQEPGWTDNPMKFGQPNYKWQKKIPYF